MQAIQLGYLPRLEIKHTSAGEKGQIYMPFINWILMLSCIGLVVVFKDSDSLAGLYGANISTTLLITTTLFFVASRKFLDRYGCPADVDDLQGAPLLAYSLVHGDGVVTQDTEQGRKTIRFTPVLQTGNETLMHYACLEGMGFTFLPKWLVSDDLAAGRLERVLPEKLRFAGKLLAVYPSRKYLSVKVRSFLGFIARDSRLK